MIKRGIITLASKNEQDFQVCQVKYLGKTKNIELVLPYGLYSNPKEESIVILLNIGANEENVAGIPYNPYIRFKELEAGEVAIGNPHANSKVYFKNNGDIEIESSGNINICSSSAHRYQFNRAGNRNIYY
jgi:phage gp45-like